MSDGRTRPDADGGRDAGAGRTLTRRRLLAAASTATAAGLAGCTGSGGGEPTDDEDGPDAGEGTGTDDPAGVAPVSSRDGGTYTMEPQGVLTRNTVEELTVLGWRSRLDQGYFVITLTVRNAGDERTDVMDYSYEVDLYAADGSEVRTAGVGLVGTAKTAPGEVGEAEVMVNLLNEDRDVARYEVALTCSTVADAAYCDGE